MKKAFTFIELIFVIVIMGILANFGTNILMTTYESYTASSTNNKMLANIELTFKQISNRLQYRIKDSVIARPSVNGAVSDITSATANSTVLEWIGYDIDGWLGTGAAIGSAPTWSGFIDVDDGDDGNPATALTGALASQVGANPYLESPGTNIASVNAMIAALSPRAIASPAIFFTGANSNTLIDYGWSGAMATQNGAAHPVTSLPAQPTTRLYSNTIAPSFSGINVYENYKLAWSAYSISLEDFDGDGDNDLVFYFDYQPWNGGTAPTGTNVRRQLLLENVDTFKFQATGETITLQICLNEDALGAGDGGYSLCEAIAIF